MDKLTTFQDQAVSYLETQQVKEGVETDLYSFNDDDTKDLAIVRVAAGHKTPLQRILKGHKTLEGYLEGEGTLEDTHPNGDCSISSYPSNLETKVYVTINDIMQWSAKTNLVFYEVCWPPYEDGRFEDLN